MAPGFRQGVLQARGREGVLAADVHVPLRTPGGDPGDRERLDDRVRVGFHHDAVLERSRFGLVGVADEVVRVLELLGHGLPLDPGGERGAAATQQLRIGDLSEGLLRPQLDRPPQRLVPVMGPVVVDRGRVDGPDATQQPQRRPSIGVPRLWRRRHLWVGGTRELLSRQRLGHQVLHLPRIDLAERRVLRALARRLHQCHGRAFAHAETRAAHPGDLALGGTRFAERGLQRVADQLATAHAARQVVTGVDHDLGSGLDAEHRVEGGDAVGLGGRHRESFAHVVEAALADPSHPGLQGVQGGQQQVALLASRAASPGHAVRDLVALGAVPAAGGFAQEIVDRCALVLRGRGEHQVQVHGTTFEVAGQAARCRRA